MVPSWTPDYLTDPCLRRWLGHAYNALGEMFEGFCMPTTNLIPALDGIEVMLTTLWEKYLRVPGYWTTYLVPSLDDGGVTLTVSPFLSFSFFISYYLSFLSFPPFPSSVYTLFLSPHSLFSLPLPSSSSGSIPLFLHAPEDVEVMPVGHS